MKLGEGDVVEFDFEEKSLEFLVCGILRLSEGF